MSGSVSIVQIDALFEQAVKLSADDRAKLATQLRSSVAAVQPALHPSWGPELARRVAKLDAGDAALIPAEDVFAEMRRIIDSYGTGK